MDHPPSSPRSTEELYRVRIQQALLQASVWIGDLEAPDTLNEDQRALAAETGQCLLEVLRDARAAGVSDRMQVSWHQTTITLTAAAQLAEYVAKTASQPTPGPDAGYDTRLSQEWQGD